MQPGGLPGVCWALRQISTLLLVLLSPCQGDTCGAAEVSALSSARSLQLAGISDTLLLWNALQMRTNVLKEALQLTGNTQKLCGASQHLNCWKKCMFCTTWSSVHAGSIIPRHIYCCSLTEQAYNVRKCIQIVVCQDGMEFPSWAKTEKVVLRNCPVKVWSQKGVQEDVYAVDWIEWLWLCSFSWRTYYFHVW